MTKPITIKFATDTEAAKRGMADLGATIQANMVKSQSAMDSVAQSSSGLARGLADLLQPIAGVSDGLQTFVYGLEAVARVCDEVSEALKDPTGGLEKLLKVAKGAGEAGVGSSFFQAFIGQMKDMGVEAEKAIAILNHAREAASVRIGVGEDAENASTFGNRLTQHVRAGNISAGDRSAYDAAETVEAQYRAALDLIDKLREQGKELAGLDLARTMFGDTFEQQLRSGVDATGKMREALDGMKVAGGVRIASDEEVAKAKEIDAKTKEIQNTMAQGLRPIIADIVSAQQDSYRAWLDIELKVANIVKFLGEMYVKVKQVLKELREDILKPFVDLGLVSPPVQGPEVPDGLTVDVKKGRPDRGSKTLPSLTGKGSGDGTEADAVEAYIRGLEKARDVAKAELDTVGKTNVERERALSLARAEAAAREDVAKGRRTDPTLTDDERQRTLALAEAKAKLRDQEMDLQQALRQTADLYRYAGTQASDALGRMIFDGARANDVLADLLRTAGRALLTGALSGQGPFAGLLGTAPAASAGPNAVGGLFGAISSAFRANGGPVTAGVPYTIGEVGAELFVPNQNGRVVPIDRSGGGNLAGATVTHAPTYNITPAQGVTPDQLAAVIDRNNRQFAASLPGMMRSARGRGQV